MSFLMTGHGLRATGLVRTLRRLDVRTSSPEYRMILQEPWTRHAAKREGIR